MRGNSLIQSVILVFILAVSLAQPVSAIGVTLATSQNDYYYLTTESAVIPLEITNSFSHKVNGMLTVSYAQRMDREGTIFSGINSQTREFAINPGKNVINLGLGDSNSNLLVKADFNFSYDGIEVKLKEIMVHYVEDESEKIPNSVRKESSSKESEYGLLMDIASNDPEFIKYDDSLKADGLEMSGMEFKENLDKTELYLTYVNKNKKVSTMVMTFKDRTLEKTELIKPLPWVWIILILAVSALGIFWFFYPQNLEKPVDQNIIQSILQSKSDQNVRLQPSPIPEEPITKPALTEPASIPPKNEPNPTENLPHITEIQ